jgi:hypothetical protein
MGRTTSSSTSTRKHEGVDLLDNKSTITIFCNPDMVEDIQDIKHESLELVTNAGILQTTQKATIPGWGRAWCNEETKTNIFSYAEINF